MYDINLFNHFDENAISSPWIKLPSQDWNKLTSLGERNFYKKNTIIYNCNEYSNYVYIVDSGKVELYILDSLGNNKIIGVCGNSSLFGEIQLFDDKPNFCTAKVSVDAWIYKMHKDVFMEAISNNHQLMLANLYNLATKIRILYTQIEFLSFKPSDAKIALMLISMCKDFGLKTENNEYKLNITFTHNDLANITGLSRVTVSNTLLKFIEKGFLRKEGSEYFIVDIYSLQKLVE